MDRKMKLQMLRDIAAGKLNPAYVDEVQMHVFIVSDRETYKLEQIEALRKEIDKMNPVRLKYGLMEHTIAVIIEQE